MFKPEVFSFEDDIPYSRPAMMLSMINDICAELRAIIPLSNETPRKTNESIMSLTYFKAALYSNYSGGYSIACENGIDAMDASLNYADCLADKIPLSASSRKTLEFLNNMGDIIPNRLSTNANMLSKTNISTFDKNGRFRRKWKALFRVSRAELEMFGMLDSNVLSPSLLAVIASKIDSDSFVDNIYNHIKEVFTSAYKGAMSKPFGLLHINIFALSTLLFHTAILANDAIATWMSVVAEKNAISLLRVFTRLAPGYNTNNKGVNRRIALAFEYLFTASCGKLFRVPRSQATEKIYTEMHKLAITPVTPQVYVNELRALVGLHVYKEIQKIVNRAENNQVPQIMATTDVYYTDHLQAIGRWVISKTYTPRPTFSSKVTNQEPPNLYLTLNKVELTQFLRFPNRSALFRADNVALTRDNASYAQLLPAPMPTMPTFYPPVPPPMPTMPTLFPPVPPTTKPLPMPTMPTLFPPVPPTTKPAPMPTMPTLFPPVPPTTKPLPMPTMPTLFPPVPPTTKPLLPTTKPPPPTPAYTAQQHQNESHLTELRRALTSHQQKLYEMIQRQASYLDQLQRRIIIAELEIEYNMAILQYNYGVPIEQARDMTRPQIEAAKLLKQEYDAAQSQQLSSQAAATPAPQTAYATGYGSTAYSDNAGALAVAAIVDAPAVATKESLTNRYRKSARHAANSYQTFESRQRSGFTDLDLRQVLY